MKPLLFLDIEVYCNYFLTALRSADGWVGHFEMYEGHPLDTAGLMDLLSRHTIVTFNGNHFDLPLLGIALRDGATCAQIKMACDQIIAGGLKAWDIERLHEVGPPKCDHIDLIEVAPGFNSLKILGGRMHAPKLQDLPIQPSDEIEEDDRALIREYCGNDLRLTEMLYLQLEPQIKLRESMREQYKIDLRSKSDAQIAEAVIAKEVTTRLKSKVIRPRIPSGTTYEYRPPAWLCFKTTELHNLMLEIQSAEYKVGGNGAIIMPPALKDRQITLGGSTYTLGIGGLHSNEKSIAHHSDADTLLIDRDVASYYPSIILRCGLAPTQMGDAFLPVYQGIVDRRLKAKAAGDKVTADVLKIVVNGSFGKFGSMFSDLYAPDLMIQVTLTGQLALLALIESLELEGVTIVSANTDGVVMKCPVELHDDAEFVVWEWECVTGFVTEETRYRALYSKDVNNYVALKLDGGYKAKGLYAAAGLTKTPANTICTEAVLAYLMDGTPVEQTIRACTDIRKFLTLRQVKGGAMKDEEYLGRAVRWYYSTECLGPITYAENGNAVARSDGGRPCMTLPDRLPDDIHFQWYIHEANEILVSLGAVPGKPTPKKKTKQLEAA